MPTFTNVITIIVTTSAEAVVLVEFAVEVYASYATMTTVAIAVTKNSTSTFFTDFDI